MQVSVNSIHLDPPLARELRCTSSGSAGMLVIYSEKGSIFVYYNDAKETSSFLRECADAIAGTIQEDAIKASTAETAPPDEQSHSGSPLNALERIPEQKKEE